MENMPPPQKTDHEIVLAALAGDRPAFSALVERYVSPIYKFSYRYVRNGSDAEDVTQETFLRVWKSLKRFDPSKNFKTWIFAIAKNASLDILKKKRPMPFSSIGEGDDIVEAVLAPYVAVLGASDAALDQILLRKDFEMMLAKLPSRYREIMLLRYTDNLKFREIAECLREPIDTVKSRHRRGLALLRTIAGARELAAD